MKIRNKKALAAACMILAGICVSGCGRAEEEDAASHEVLKITVAPEPSPTPAPENINPDAVSTNGDMTMINSYLMEKSGSVKDGRE